MHFKCLTRESLFSLLQVRLRVRWGRLWRSYGMRMVVVRLLVSEGLWLWLLLRIMVRYRRRWLWIEMQRLRWFKLKGDHSVMVWGRRRMSIRGYGIIEPMVRSHDVICLITMVAGPWLRRICEGQISCVNYAIVTN